MDWLRNRDVIIAPIVSSRGRRSLGACAALVALHSPCPLEAAEITIRHEPPACVLADTFPRLTARVEAPGAAPRVRVAFRPESAAAWYAVVAEAVDGGFSALLPRPRMAAGRIHYRFEATGADASVVKSPDYTAAVVADASACPGAVAEGTASASVLVEVPPGAPLVPPVPAGFDPVGAVSNEPQKGRKKKIGMLR